MPILPLRYRRVFAGAATTGVLVVLFCLSLLRGNPGIFFNDDYQISILPVFADVARSWNAGHLPLLSPYSWACGNLAGEYQYGTFSVFINAVVVLVWKFSLTFAQQAAALSVAHLAVLAAGGYLLARERRLTAPLAGGVGLICALNGWEMGWGATDWFGALAANTWLPWCWWAFEVALKKGEGRTEGGWMRDAKGGCGTRSGGRGEAEGGERQMEAERGGGWRERLRFLLPAPFVYLLVAAGFPYTDVMLGLVTVWLAVRELVKNGWRWRIPFVLGMGWGLGLMLSAPAWLSLLEAVHGSGRSQEGVGAGNLAWTVPWRALPGLILPNWTVQWSDFANKPCTHGAVELAGGIVPLVGVVAGLIVGGRKTWRALRWDLGLLGTVLLLCLLPSPGLFRWSFRWLPLFHLALALTGGRALLNLAAGRQQAASEIDGGWKRGALAEWSKNPGVWATAAVVSTWVAMRIVHANNPDPRTDSLTFWMLGVAVGWTAWEALPMRRSQRLWASALAVLASLGGTYHYAETNTGLPIYPVPQSLKGMAPLSSERLYLSFYREPDRYYKKEQVPPGFGPVIRLGSMGMYAGVRMINGYSPIMSEGVGKVLHMETHGNVPEAVGGPLLTGEAGEDGLLARLGVDGIIRTHDYQTPARPPEADWAMVHSTDEGDVYERRGGPLARVRAWTSAEPGGAPTYAPASVRVVENSRQRVEADVGVPEGGAGALIAFSRPYYPGYRATFNGKRLAVGTFRGMLPTVEVPAGARGKLVLRYVPRAVVLGGVVAAAGVLLAVGLGLVALGRRERFCQR